MRKGRDLEELVAGFQRMLEGTGAEVTSPDFLPGLRSGAPREVDVSVRMRVADEDVLVVLECRDRGSPQGVDWVDALVGKRADLDVNKVIAVSSSGYTRNAKRAAAAAGIELRTVLKVDERVLAEAVGIPLVVDLRRVKIDDVAIGTVGTRPEDVAELAAAWPAPLATSAPILLSGGTRDPLSLDDIWLHQISEQDRDRLYESLKPNGEEATAEIVARWEAPEKRPLARTSRGEFPVTRIDFTLRLWIEETRVPLSHFREYRREEELLGRAAEFRFDADGKRMIAVVYGTPEGTVGHTEVRRATQGTSTESR